MKTASSKGSKDRKKIAAIVVIMLVAVGVLYYELHDFILPATPAPIASAPVPAPAASANNLAPSGNPPTGAAAKPLGTTSAALDPTLHMEAMLVTESLEYSGSGRNIFSASSAPPVVIQKPLASARITGPAPVVVPCPPNCPPPPPPPPPPPIDLKFFGTETASDGTRQAFLLHDDSVFLASSGDVVLRRYRVVSIEAKSIRVEDMQYKDTQTLPLLTN
jgi:hypothetical protein